MPDPAKNNEVDMASKIQILTRAMSVSSIETLNPATGFACRTYSTVEDVIANYKKLYAALTSA